MSRNLLHKKKLPEFVQWLQNKGIQYRDPRGVYQVLQVLTPKASWQCIFNRDRAPEHYTVAQPLEGMVQNFIRDSK